MSEKDSPPTVAGAAPDCRAVETATDRIPFWLTNAISAPELRELEEHTLFASSLSLLFC
jgi:hypothetical protein